MRILVFEASAPAGQTFEAEGFLAQEYPDAERLYVSNQADLIQVLEREAIDLALLDSSVDQKHSSDLLQLIHDRLPGLPVIWITQASSATQAALEQELRHSQVGLDTLLNTPTDAIMIFDAQRRITLANQTFYQHSGKRPEDVIGRTLFDIFPPAMAEKRDAVLRQVIETGEPVRFEDQSTPGWLDNTVVPVRNPQGRVIHVMVYAHDITGLKKVEKELRTSQQVISALLNAPTDVILLLDRQGEILTGNQTFCQRFGVTPEDLLGRSLFEFLPPALAQNRYEMVKQAFETGKIVHFEDQGSTGWFDNTIYPVLDNQNQVTFVTVIARDVSERKRLEEDLRRDQRIMLAMANAPGNIFVVLDRAGTILTTNEVMARSLDHQVDELIGHCFWDLLPKPVADFRREIFNKVIRTGLPERAEDYGRFGTYDSWVVPITDDLGDIIQVAIIARDITDRKRSELALKASEEKYRTLVETSPDGIIYYDLTEKLDGRLGIINQRFVELFGYESPEEMFSFQLAESDLVAEHERSWLEEIIKEGLERGFVRDVVITARRKDGSEFQLEANGAMVHDPHGKPMGFLGICRDVTERTRLQAELVRARENMEQRVIERTAELQAINRQLRKEVFLRKQAEEQWQRQALNAGALAQVAARANAQLGLKAVLDAICTEVIHALPYPVSSISLHQEEDDCLHIAAYASGVTINSYDVPPTPRVLLEEYLRQSGSIIVIPDVANLPNANFLTTRTTPEIRTLITLPLYHQGEILGTLSVVSVAEIRIPSTNELDLLFAISDQAVLSIANARLFERVSEGQANLKMLTERLVEVQEAERRYLARELHDEIGQNLTSLSLNLEIITRLIETGEKSPTLLMEMESIRGQVKELLNQVRDLSLNLLPAMLDDLGLLPTLLDHCQRFTVQTGIRVELAHHGLERRLSVQLETAAYRIIQEALTNVARYARVDQVEVRLWATPYQLGLQVEDEGAGFDLQLVESGHRSSGLAGMRERAANCGGSLEIETTPGLGTCLTAEFPLDDRKPTRGIS